MTVEVIATLQARPERETDVRRYDLYRDSTRSATFHMLEAYADEAAFEAHLESAHYLSFGEQAGGWLMAAPMVAVLNPVAVARDE